MPSFVMLSRITPGSFKSSDEIRAAATKVRKMIESEVPGARWICSYALMGEYDAVDIFEAPDVQHAFSVSGIVRLYGHSTTVTMVGEEWNSFLKKAGKAA